MRRQYPQGQAGAQREAAGAAAVALAEGDHVAAIGDNRKLLIFPLAQLPEMRAARACGCRNTRTAAFRDAKMFDPTGLTWKIRPGEFRLPAELRDWRGNRADAGRLRRRDFRRATGSADGTALEAGRLLLHPLPAVQPEPLLRQEAAL